MRRGYIGARIPAAERYGVLCLRVSDFQHHKHEIIHRVLPKRERIMVTAWGFPDFEVHRVPVEASQTVQRTEEDPQWYAKRDGEVYVPTSYFLSNLHQYVTVLLPQHDRLIITRWGEPEWAAAQITWDSETKIDYGGIDALDYDAPEEVDIPEPEIMLREEG